MTDRTNRLALAAAEAMHALAEALTDWAEDGPPEPLAANEEQELEDAWQSRDWETVRRLQDEAEQREGAPEPDPLDEEDHRDRMTGDGYLLVRNGPRHWHRSSGNPVPCSVVHEKGLCSLDWWNAASGPLTFAPDAAPDAPHADLTASEGEYDAVEGAGAAGPNLNVQNKAFCHACGHGIEQHMGFGCYPPAAGEGSGCSCRLSVTDVARHLIAQATS